MIFVFWMYDGFYINLIFNIFEGDILNYIFNSEWYLYKFYVDWKVVYYFCCVELYLDIMFYIYILWWFLFYVFNMVMLCIMIMLVVFFGFYILLDFGNEVYFYFL